MKKIKLVLTPVIIVALCAGAVLFFRFHRALPLTYTPGSYPESAAELNNPYCGFYRIFAYRLTGKLPDESALSGSIAKAPGRLALLQFNLRDWQNTQIGEDAISQLDFILSHWASSNKQLILRFFYDWDGKAEETEPTDLSIIQTHMNQVAEICNRYAARVYLIQGLFTGNHGEMHHTHHQSAEAMAALATTLYDATEPSIFLSVRTPKQWRAISELTSGRLDDRMGLFNDGLLGSSSDTGTYSDRNRDSEIAFQNELCASVPNGGEVIILNEYNDLENAISDFSKMHVSYLNMDYDQEVLDKWKNSYYSGDDVFYGCSGYQYMETHLGYRYVLRDSSFSFQPQDARATLSVTIENVGFSPNYMPFLHEIILISRSNEGQYSYQLKYPVIPTGEKAVLSCTLPVREMTPDTYDIYIKTTDSFTAEIIQYGNALPLSPYGYAVGSLTFDKK